MSVYRQVFLFSLFIFVLRMSVKIVYTIRNIKASRPKSGQSSRTRYYMGPYEFFERVSLPPGVNTYTFFTCAYTERGINEIYIKAGNY